MANMRWLLILLSLLQSSQANQKELTPAPATRGAPAKAGPPAKPLPPSKGNPPAKAQPPAKGNPPARPAAPAPAPAPAPAGAPGDPATEKSVRQALDAAACSGHYADEAIALASKGREYESKPDANYSYCLRNTSTYECLHYGEDGKVKKRRLSVVTHGTAFAYKKKGGESFLLTNAHIAVRPVATRDSDHVTGIPAGCKKIEEKLRLVRDESDEFEPGHILVAKVAEAAPLDAAIIKTRHKVTIMPYRIGHSAFLKAGNVVAVKGFPLGRFQATNFGKVVSAYDRDSEREWDHVDFITDALLTSGNSGSPALAISCKTGELELVGLYHAGYRESPALNAVVAIDELRSFMESLSYAHPHRSPDDSPFSAAMRKELVAALASPDVVRYFKIGERFVHARIESETTIVFEIFNDRFPFRPRVEVTLRDVLDEEDSRLESFSLYVKPDQLWVRTEDADAETLELVQSLLDLTRRQLYRTLEYRKNDEAAERSREANKLAGDLFRQLDRGNAEINDLLKSLSEVSPRIKDAAASGWPASPTTAPPRPAKPAAPAVPKMIPSAPQPGAPAR